MFTDNSNIIWSTSCVYSKHSVIYPHRHAFFQYLYVKSGGGRIRIGDSSYELLREHIYIINPESTHEIESGEDGLITYEIKFDTSCEELKRAILELPPALSLPTNETEAIFGAIFNEMRNLHPYQNEMLKIKFHELLFHILRQNDFSKKSEQKNVDFSEKFAEILFYMDQHIAENISLATLAKIAHSEKIYFLKQFKKEMGITPMDYLRNLRISEAKKLLEHSDMNITQISTAVGFASIHHFSSVFTKIAGITPSEYKLKKRSELLKNA